MLSTPHKGKKSRVLLLLQDFILCTPSIAKGSEAIMNRCVFICLFSLRLVMKMRLRRNNRKRMNAGPTAELDLNMTYSEACLTHQPAGHDHREPLLALH